MWWAVCGVWCDGVCGVGVCEVWCDSVCVVGHVCMFLFLYADRIQKKLEEAMDGPIDVILVKQVCITQ